MTADDTNRTDVTPTPENDHASEAPPTPPPAETAQDSPASAFSPQGDDAPRGRGRAAQTITRRPIASALTVAMTAGMLPVALGLHGDSSFRAPMAIAVIGGLLLSTVLTLVIVPAAFTLADDLERKIGPWLVFISGFGEMLPHPDNRLTLGKENDKWGMAIPHIDVVLRDNEHKMVKHILDDGKAMIEAAGGIVISQASEPGVPGLGIHEMGTARMGTDPKTSVLGKFNQAHDVPNLYITDGAAMASSGCQNPSLTYMALSARAANHAADLLKEGQL